MTKLTPADYADTGQWRLIINIRQTGIDARLENTLHPDVESFQLIHKNWEKNEENYLLNIENSVYDNPRVLDDFASKIIIHDYNTIFLPSEIVQNQPGIEEDIYSDLFSVKTNDVFSETDSDIVALWHGVKGLKSFLLRTFPGSVITTSLLTRIKELRNLNINIVLVDRREEETDYIIMEGDKLIAAVCRESESPETTLYHVLNLLEVFEKNPSEFLLEWRGVLNDKILYNSCGFKEIVNPH